MSAFATFASHSLSVRLCIGFAAAALLSALMLIAGFSGTASYLAMILALLALVAALFDWRGFRALDSSFPALFIVAYAIFAFSVVFPARPEGSAIFVFDFIPFVLAIGLYAGLCRIDRETLVILFGYGSLLGVLFSFGIGAFQVFSEGLPRANGIGGSAIYYANISLLLGFLALTPAFSTKGWRWYFIAGPILGIAAAFLSGSRSTLPVGAVLVLVFVVHMAMRHRLADHAKTWLVAILAFAGVVGIMATALFVVDNLAIARIAATFDQTAALLQGNDIGDRSMAYRFDFYASGIAAFMEAPWTGHGWHQAFNAAAPFMDVYDPARDSAGAVRHLHNDALNFAVSFGIPGFVAYALALAAPLASWWRNRPRAIGYGSYCVFGVVLAYLVMGLTDTNFVYEAPKVMFCFTAAGAAALASRRASK